MCKGIRERGKHDFITIRVIDGPFLLFGASSLMVTEGLLWEKLRFTAVSKRNQQYSPYIYNIYIPTSRFNLTCQDIPPKLQITTSQTRLLVSHRAGQLFQNKDVSHSTKAPLSSPGNSNRSMHLAHSAGSVIRGTNSTASVLV